ncbi:unnamed protein product [Cuscuta europaea]|uniref:Uncharacterized protein n=1 Tax=Cuscuta europaea TaxID=41803 RepID=A0A9P0ZU18_CUSEU|nr:unnamed protein product [Cuscuta europaea]
MAAETTDITSSPTRNPAKPISSFLGSPTRILNGFLGRTTSQSAMDHSTSMSMSPTSTLDAKQFLNIGHHIGYEKTPNLTQKSSPTRNHNPVCTEKRPDSLGVSLALIEDSRRGQVLFGSKLKIQIPSLISPVESPVGSPGDFGTKTPRNLPPLLSSVVQAGECPSSPEGLSLSEMELSEDYTCVITHGPNPKTTRIFGNCVVEESCCEVMKGNCSSLSSCQNCSINHGDEQSIYNYRIPCLTEVPKRVKNHEDERAPRRIAYLPV